MSMRPRVGQQEIEQFLIQVGRTRQPGRLYITGGAALVHRGIRPQLLPNLSQPQFSQHYQAVRRLL